jgi:hemolysin activation/secretion protein
MGAGFSDGASPFLDVTLSTNQKGGNVNGTVRTANQRGRLSHCCDSILALSDRIKARFSRAVDTKST